MGIYERMRGDQDPKLAVHLFTAVAAERARGVITAAQAKSALGLSDAEAAEAQTLIDRVTSASTTREIVEDVLLLLDSRLYTVAQAKTRLGV